MEKLKNSDFVHLHLHSEYSLLDGALRIKDIPRLAKEAGHTAVALTDHGNMYGAVAFYRACKAEGIRPIIGCEVYVAPTSRFTKMQEREGSYAHLILLCENEKGYANLIRLVSLAYLEGFYVKPRIDMELLTQFHEGLICLSACVAGLVPKRLLRGDYEGAKSYAEELDRLFGRGNFFLEIQNHGIEQEREAARGIRTIAEETGIPLVATNDVHYARKTDADTQAVLMCIGTNTDIHDGRPLGFETDEFYYKSTEEMTELFPKDTEALRNTGRIAERCSFDFSFDKYILPAFNPPDNLSAPDYLRKLTSRGFVQKIASRELVFTDEHPIEEYKERIAYELSVICQMGYAEYYLIVWDFVHYAKNEGIPVGPGRGSGAGSLVAYCIGITDVDSIRWNLMFERFLNPERVSMPDFDIDFCDSRRGEVIEYVKQKYGADHVAQITTFGTLAPRAAVRDVGRALGMTYAETDTVAKAIPQEIGITLAQALTQVPELKAQYDSSSSVQRLIDTAMAIEGMPRHASTHAAGVVITDKPVMEYVPLSENSGSPVTQYDMDTIAALGLLKIDFLGLRYLTIMADAEQQIKETNPKFDLQRIPIDDKPTYSMISSGATLGVFQLESAGMRSMLTQLNPDNLEMIVAAISLYRPGPMESIPKFIESRLHPEKITYMIPCLAPILDVTFGCIVYQEQVMQICRAVAGYSFARADLVRRAMAKKKADVMEKEREYFVNGQKNSAGDVILTGAVANGISSDAANALFDEMAAFAKYAFNKSHATAYAFTSYRTAYLKCHYPAEYFSALLTSVSGDTGKTAQYVSEAQHAGVSVLPPNINESSVNYHVTVSADGRKSIRFGLLAVRNIGIRFIEEIITERKDHGAFHNFDDFVLRMSGQECTKKQVEMLIKCGAFDGLGKRRSQLYSSFEQVVDSANDRARAVSTGQLDLFQTTDAAEGISNVDGFRYPDIPELSRRDLLAMEREATGQYFSGHLLDDYTAHLEKIHPAQILDILEAFSDDDDSADTGKTPSAFRDGQIITIAGIIANRSMKQTKKGENMAFLKLEDRCAEIEVLVFPSVLERYQAYIVLESGIAITGTLSIREGESPKLLARSMEPLTVNGQQLEQSSPKSASRYPTEQNPMRQPHPKSGTAIPQNPRKLYLRVPSMAEGDRKFLLAKNLCHLFDGTLPVIFYGEAEKLYQKTPLAPNVTLTPYTLLQFEELLGRENVIVK